MFTAPAAVAVGSPSNAQDGTGRGECSARPYLKLVRLPRFNPALLTTMALWGFNFVAVKLVLEQVPPISSAFIRGLVMYAGLLAICVASGVSLRFPPGTWWRISVQGFLSLGLYMILFVLGMDGSTPAEGAILLGTSPVFTLLIACLFRQETFRWSILGGTLVAFAGVGIVVAASPGAHVGSVSTAHLLVLASAFVWALATVVSRPLVHEVPPLQMLTLSMPAGLITLLPFCFGELQELRWQDLTLTTWSMLLYFGIAAGLAGFLLFYKGVRQVGASGAMVYQYLVAPIAAVFGFLVLGSGMAPLQFLGLVVVLGGVALSNLARQKYGDVPTPVE